MNVELFDKAYAARPYLFGRQPSRDLRHFLAGVHAGGQWALDLGCGQGRDSMLLARSGYRVLGMDLAWNGVRFLRRLAGAENLPIDCVNQDIATYAFPPERFQLIVCATVLELLSTEERRWVAKGVERALRRGGHLYAETFTTGDPGYKAQFGALDGNPTPSEPSEFAGAVRHYSAPGELESLFNGLKPKLSVERTLVDRHHGQPHHHCLAIFIASRG